ncbi:anoctamin-10 isoform X2 [Halyomorpha halys]|uniref:anoctamin-10 isoform X2 n=1 Tax=Halyomorpha halys TaxID=286706 RepID=UPI0006D4D740|nr:anoctamin-10 isoform X2 [Halyomorpha halys]
MGEYLDKKLDENFPPSYIVIKFNRKIKHETAKWLVEKITKEKKKGGAELLVRCHPSGDGSNLTIHVSAQNRALLGLAEDLEVRKRDKHGNLREFTMDELSEFTDVEEMDEFLTTSEKQTIVRHEIENIRALSNESSIVGYPNYPLYEGQSIMMACLYYGIIKKMYPLHDEEAVRKLGARWYKRLFEQQPYDDIRVYFGESVALYFQFIGFYTISLIGPTLLGFLQMLVDPGAVAVFSILNIVCATLFLEFWRRKCSELAYLWGTISMTSFDEPRPNFRGTMGIDAVTGKLLPQAPRFKTHIKMYCVSLPLVFVCMIGAFIIMLLSFWVEDQLRVIPNTPMWVIYAPSVIYAGLIYAMNMVYRRFANFLTEWENHRTQSQFDRHRVTKLVLFEFVNNFMSLFYIAFIIQDMDLLRYQLATLLIVLQAINNIQEAILPFALRCYSNKYASFRSKNSSSKVESKKTDVKKLIEAIGVKELDPEDSRIKQAITEGMMEQYDDPYDDYLEMFVQFGYVYLFSAVYPMAAFWAVFNNVLEIRCDAFKLCCVYQRPIARKVKDTGAWQRAFQALSTLSVVTNCALLSLNPALRSQASEGLKPESWFLIFVCLEHLLLGCRQIIHYAIPDKPEWVRLALARGNYKAKQALKLQRIIQTQAHRPL